MSKVTKNIIKLFIIAGIIVFALWNYRFLTFNKGLSNRNSPNNQTITQTLYLLSNIQKVEYYEKTIKQDKYIYNIYIETSDDSYLLQCTQDDVDSFKTMSIFSGNLKPIKIAPIPFYVEIIVILIIGFIPTETKKN